MIPDAVDDRSEQSASLDVLLVDDDQQWAEFIAQDLESEADDLAVTVALGANEAMLALQERNDFDCIVTDYQMPEIDGLELLKRVRTDHPSLPCLLITGAGSEDVAAEAIEAGVSDYMVKDPKQDQTSVLLDKIRRTVERYRLEQAVRASEERYRKVIEQSQEAIAIVRDGQIVFANRRFVELTERDDKYLAGEPPLAEVVHEQDVDDVGAVIDTWHAGEQEDTLQELRIVRPDGTVRHCEFTGSPIEYSGTGAVLVSIRDVTEQKQRRRELEWERELNRAVQKTLVESRTQADLEDAVVSQLQEQGYALAWIGQQEGDRLVPRTVAGERDYLDQVDCSLDGGESDSEPGVWAARTGEPQFLQDFEELFSTAWRATATACGYRSGAALPLEHKDVSYGILAVYHEAPDRFDETERRLLTEMSDTVAFAIHSLNTENALASDRSVTAEVKVADRSYYLVDLGRDGVFVNCDDVSVQGTVPHGDEEYIQYLTVTGGECEPIRESVSGHPSVRDVAVIAEDEPVRLQVTVSDPVPETHITSHGAVVHSTSIGADGATVEIELPSKAGVRTVAETLETEFGTASVRSVVEQDRPTTRDLGAKEHGEPLTRKQATALEAAYHHGYFEQPRRSSATEVAESLDVSHSTFLEHLRAAQRKVFERRFGNGGDG